MIDFRRVAFLTSISLLAGLLVSFLFVGCNSGDGPTGPSPVTAPTIAPGQGIVGVTTIAPTQPASTDSVSVIKIDAQGTVTITKPRSWTACIYKYSNYQEQTFSHSYAVREGVNPFQRGPLCGPTLIQIDVQEGPTCPSDPWAGPFQVFKNGRAGITLSDPTPCPTPTPTPSPTPTPTPTPTPSPTPTPPPPCQYSTEWTLTNTRADKTEYELVVSTEKYPESNPGSILFTFKLKGGQSATFNGPASTTLYVYYHLGKNYDYATEATSTSCPVEAQGSWKGDASLKSKCVCKVR